MKKKKLIVSLILIVVCVASLTAASFAWFSSNQTVSVQAIQVSVTASNGIQISSNATTPKASLLTTDLTGASFTGNQNQIPSVLSPVSSPKTLTSQFLDLYAGEIDSSTGSFYLVTTKESEATPSGSATAASTSGNFVAFDVFVHSTKIQNLELSATSSVTYAGGETDPGLKNATRVAVINQGYHTVPATAIALDDGTAAWLWEPNANIHTANGVAAANNTYAARTGGSVTTSTVIAGYDAVKAAMNVAAAVPLGTIASGSGAGLNFTLLSNTSGIDLQTNANALGVEWTASNVDADNNVITQINVGINKLRVYAWVEGQDVDCENEASGSSIAFNLGFSVPDIE